MSGIIYDTGMHSCNRNTHFLCQDISKISHGCLSIAADSITLMANNFSYLKIQETSHEDSDAHYH